MSHSVRFLALAIAAWAGVRAITLGLDPGRDALAATLDDSQLSEAAQGPTAPASASPPPAPGMRSSPMAYWSEPSGWGTPYPVQWMQPQWQPQPQTIVRIVQPPAQYASAPPLPAYYYGATYPSFGSNEQLSAVPVGSIPPDMPPPLPSASPPLQSQASAGPKRLRMSGWGQYRLDRDATAASLAPVGTLGGSQAGARILYRVAPGIDLSARHSVSFGRIDGQEGALGVRYQPFAGIPLAFTAERRQRISGYGRSDFAAFAEYGAYGVQLPADFTADGYAQAGIVGLKSMDWFMDAQLSAKRPIWKGVSAGASIWTAAQPGLNRVDIGPRLSFPVKDRLTVNAEYRFNVAGNAAPASGPAVTFGGDF